MHNKECHQKHTITNCNVSCKCEYVILVCNLFMVMVTGAAMSSGACTHHKTLVDTSSPRHTDVHPSHQTQ